VYAINTVGSILGSFLGGLLVLPLLQIQTTLQAMALLYAAPGIILLTLSPGWQNARTRAMTMILCLAVLAGCFAPRWEPSVMSSGMFLLRDSNAVRAVREWRLKDGIPNLNRAVLYYREGAAATVAVARVNESISLSVGGKPDASSHTDMSTQIGLTLLPAVLHPAPKDVLVIGQGSGVSTGAALARSCVERVDLVEMSPEVITASSWFHPYNGLSYENPESDVAKLKTPRLNVLINDGRNHLLLSSRKYDLIASEPSNPWMAGVGNLFTREAFQLSRNRLKPGGIMCQWIHSYSLEESHVYSIIRTFGEVYPHLQLWWINRGDYLLIGSEAPLRISIKDLRARLAEPSVNAWLARVNMETEYEFIAGFVQHDDILKKKAKDHPLHTDDNMLLEFSAPRALYSVKQTFSVAQIASLIDQVVDLDGLSTAEKADFIRHMDLAVGAREHLVLSAGMGHQHLDRASSMAPHQYWAMGHRALLAVQEFRGVLNGVERERLVSGPGVELALRHIEYDMARASASRWSEALLSRARRLLNEQRPDEALRILQFISDPLQSEALELLRARALAAQGKYDEAIAILAQLAQSGFAPLECAEAAATVLMDAGRHGDAVSSLMSVLGNPSAATDTATRHLWCLLAKCLLKLTDFDGAENAAKVAQKMKAMDPESAEILSEIYLLRKKPMEAIGFARRSFVVDPENHRALGKLIQAIHALAESTAPAEMGSALSRFCAARRYSRELAEWHPEDATGWEGLARAQLALSRLDEKNADVHTSEARAACRKLLELNGNELSKLPADLRALMEASR